MLSNVRSMGLYGMDSYPVMVEADITTGLPSFELVGLPDASVKESRDRVRSAIRNCGMAFPVSHITINLAPADQKKAGPLYDLPILLAILSSSGQIDAVPENWAFVGELSLSGEVRPVHGALTMALGARDAGFSAICLPKVNAPEASVAEGIKVYPVGNVVELLGHLSGKAALSPAVYQPGEAGAPSGGEPDFSQVKGQHAAKRALEIAAAGGHNALLIGAPGAGKSMLAKRLPSILPDMSFQESIETTKIHSVAGTLPPGSTLITRRPFRSPHHTISAAGLSGGGAIPRPGEFSLAHGGVLFLDELPEFQRSVMEVMRQPMEDGVISIARAAATLSYPCQVMVIAAMNPCPCGYFGHPTRNCVCPPDRVGRYLGKISGPLLDRLDLHVEVLPVEYGQLTSTAKEEPSSDIKRRVNAARERQRARYQGAGIDVNARLRAEMIAGYCKLSPGASRLLRQAFDRMGLSARAYTSILKVARTIADLSGEEDISDVHIAEAIQYRTLDRKYWER